MFEDSHVFKQTWTPSVGEELSCKRESDNKYPYAIEGVPSSAMLQGRFPLPALCFCVETAPSTAGSLEQGAFQVIYLKECSSSGVYSLYLPRPEVSSSSACFTFAFVFSTCLSESEGTFVGYVRLSLVKYLYNAIFKASFTLVL